MKESDQKGYNLRNFIQISTQKCIPTRHGRSVGCLEMGPGRKSGEDQISAKINKAEV